MLQSAPPVLTSAAVQAPVGWYVDTTKRSAAIDEDVVVTVLVLPNVTGAFVMSVKSPPSVIPSRLIAVDDDGLRCHTAKVPVIELLLALTLLLKFVTASVASFAPQSVIGVVVG